MANTLIDLLKETKARDLPWAIVNQFILSAGSVAIIVVLSNILQTQTFGEMRFLVAILAVFAFFSLPGIGPVVMQRMSIYSRKSFKFALATQLRWGVGASIAAFIGAATYYYLGNMDLAYAFTISGILAPIANLYLMPGIVLAGLKKFKEKTFYDGFIITSAVLGAAYGAVVFETITGIMFWYFGAQSLSTCIALYLVVRQLSDTSVEEPNPVIDTQYGKQLTLFQIPFTLLPALEKILVFVLLGPIPLALYVIALLPIEHVRSAYRSLLQFFSLPHLESKANNEKMFRYLLIIACILSVGSIVIVIIFALFFLSFIFPNYTSVQPLIILSTIVLVALPAEIYILSLLSDRRIGYLFSYALITIITDIIAFVFFISIFGLYGAVIAKIITSFASAGVALSLYRLNRRPPPHIQ